MKIRNIDQAKKTYQSLPSAKDPLTAAESIITFLEGAPDQQAEFLRILDQPQTLHRVWEQAEKVCLFRATRVYAAHKPNAAIEEQGTIDSWLEQANHILEHKLGRPTRRTYEDLDPLLARTRNEADPDSWPVAAEMQKRLDDDRQLAVARHEVEVFDGASAARWQTINAMRRLLRSGKSAPGPGEPTDQ